MEQKSESMRERLLARLPQPENSAAYREETASLMARYEKALLWEKWSAKTFMLLGVALFLFASSSLIPLRDQNLLGVNEKIFLSVSAALFFFIGLITMLGYQVSRSKVDVLKEVKQIQLQVLELQASIAKSGEKRA
jgi:type VI protein secretion system component VasF